MPVHVHSLAEWQARGHLNDVLKAMREAFASAKATAPSVLFIDEIDSFGDRAKLRGHNATYNREVINALLECLDGVDDGKAWSWSVPPITPRSSTPVSGDPDASIGTLRSGCPA